jgi:hypothetical protein
MSQTLDRHVIDEAATLLEQPGVWTRGTYDNNGHMCLIGAVLRPTCQPGDNHLWRVWLDRNGLNEGWNDDEAADAAEVITRLRAVPDPTEADMVDTFGPQWLAIRDLVRRAAVLTDDEAARLGVAWDAAGDAACGAAWGAAWGAARGAVWGAARGAALSATGGAARSAALSATGDAAGGAAGGAACALSVRDLIGQYGFTQAHYDKLTAPWTTVIGRAHPDDADRMVSK